MNNKLKRRNREWTESSKALLLLCSTSNEELQNQFQTNISDTTQAYNSSNNKHTN